MQRTMFRVGAVAVLTTLLLAGCSTGPDAESAGALTMAPGTTAHMFMQLEGDSETELTVLDDGGLAVTLPDRLHGNGSGTVAGWLGIEAGADATPGDHEVLVEASDGDQIAATVTVDASEEALGEGAVALVDLTIRAEDGTLSTTTHQAVDDSSLSRLDDYQPPQGTDPMQLLLSPQQLPPEIVGPLAAAAVGHSLTVEMPEFYGPVSQEQEQPREESLPRLDERERFVEMDRAAAEQEGFVTEETQEGDPLEVGGPIPYVVETLNETTFRAEVDLQEGDTITLIQQWPDATVVETVTDGAVVLRTDPPVAEGEPFTWNEDWPDATEVASLNDTTILLRHTLEEGSTYTTFTEQGEAQVTVVSVNETAITLSQANPHPMAGENAFVEMTVVGQEEAPQQPAVPGAGGQPGP